MTTLSRLSLLDTFHGDVVLEQQQAADIGTAMGNGAAGFASQANPGVAPMGEGGNLNVQTQQPGTSPTVTATDTIMALFSIPAGCLDVPGRMIEITANGGALNATSKTMKLVVNPTAPVVGQALSGGTVLASLVGVTANGGWNLNAEIVKYGPKGSNTQQTIHTAAQIGSTIGALQAPTPLTLNESAAIVVAVTCADATLVSDVLFNNFQVQGFN